MLETSPGSKHWSGKAAPKRILVIRFHALGDLVITFPYIRGLKKILPGTKVDLLTRMEYADLVNNIKVFDTVHALKDNRNSARLAIKAVFKSASLVSKKYDVIIDLQNNWISRMVRKFCLPKAWSAFDRYSPKPAGERTLQTIQNAGFDGAVPIYNSVHREGLRVKNLLLQYGWKEDNRLIVINPAGFFITRNWPMDYYVKFCQLWLETDANIQFLIMGIDKIENKANFLKQQLGDRLINLVGHTTITMAFSIIQHVDFVLSEDSGLMHMAWVSGKPTLALFGSSKSDWSRPLGDHSICLNSSDLECGECMQDQCKFGDVHCLTRFTPEMVFEQSVRLLNKTGT